MDIQGHRGARGLFPENTIEGFLAAAALGVTAFELDVGMTADGVVVVHHDLALNPDNTRDASGNRLRAPTPLIRSLTFAALQTFDVGHARVPTLASVLAALRNARFTVEVKTDPSHPDWTVPPETLADATLAVIDSAGAAPRVILEAFDWRVTRHIRRTRPDIRLAWLTRADTASLLWWDTPPGVSVPASVAAEGGPIWAPDYRDLTLDQVVEAKSLGLSVLPWTVNEPADMQRLAGWGVDGLITDRPDIALTLI